MVTTNFVNGITLTDQGWFNDLDATAYEGTFPSGPSALTVTGATTLGVFNTIATTVNAFGAATTLNIGATSGTLNIKNATTALIGALTQTVASGPTRITQTASTAADGSYHNFVANSVTALIGIEGTTPNYGGTSGDFIVYNNGLLRISVSTAGAVKIAGLAGTGSRTVVADANGVLSAP